MKLRQKGEGMQEQINVIQEQRFEHWKPIAGEEASIGFVHHLGMNSLFPDDNCSARLSGRWHENIEQGGCTKPLDRAGQTEFG